MKRIAILHYAGPPVVGGVEQTIAYQARGLADLGYSVRVISGSGDVFDQRIETHIQPLFGSTHPDVLRVKKALDHGELPADFDTMRDQIAAALREVLADCDVCIAHNVHTLHKNIPLSAALAQLTDEDNCRFIAWCHDLAWTNEQYRAEMHDGYPWDLLAAAWKNTQYVTVSEPRRTELAGLLGVSEDLITVVVPGVDPARFFSWTDTTTHLVNALHLLDADGILLLPARLTRRKNITLALHVLAALRQQSPRDFRLVVTGPPGPHNPTNPGYLGELLDLRRDLKLENAAHFAYACGTSSVEPLLLDDATLFNLYQLADALLFPSTQEGFGIPVLEAGLAGLPVFCADIPPLRHTGGDDAYYFDPQTTPPDDIAAQILKTLDAYPPYRLRVRVRQTYRWDSIIRSQLVPLIEN